MHLLVSRDARNEAFESADVAFAAMTRFNLHGLAPATAPVRGDPDYEDWCARRAAAFRALCLPPMLIQWPRPHAWFLLFDTEVPSAVAALLDDLRTHEWIVPLFLPRDWARALATDVPAAVRQALAPTGAERVCWARLDSDDSLNARYFAALDVAITRVRQEGEPGPAWGIDFPYGAVSEGGNVAVYVAEKFSFALVEPLTACKTPYQRKHTEIDQAVPLVRVYTDQPMWLYQRHDANIGGFNAARLERFADPNRILGLFGLSEPPSTPGSNSGPAKLPSPRR